MKNLILSTGSNLGQREYYLKEALKQLSEHFKLCEASPVYESPAVDYLNQPAFLNQVLHFQASHDPEEILNKCMNIEHNQGRERLLDKGPRTLDIDILFIDFLIINTSKLHIPHPRLFERSFIVKPFQHLSIFSQFKNHFDMPDSFSNECWLYQANV